MKELLQQLQQVALLAEAATSGPWYTYSEAEGDEAGLTGYNNMVVPQPGAAHDEDGNYNDIAGTGESYDNAAFIAAARNLLTLENVLLLIGILDNIESVMNTNRVTSARLQTVTDCIAKRKALALADGQTNSDEDSEEYVTTAFRYMEASIIELSLTQ